MAGTGAKDVRHAIEAANAVFMATFAKGDAAGLAALYGAKGQILPPNAGPVQGAGAIQAFWQGALDMGIASAKLETLEVEGHGDTAIEVGKYGLYAQGGQELDAGKYIVVWKDEDGQWKLHRDIYNSSKPAPG
jgi:uncharacterized protein (TIGR02246 family)